jgi:hypothetical protein
VSTASTSSATICANQQVADVLNGCVSAVIGGFELAGWLVTDVGAVVTAAVGEGSAEPFVEEQEEQRHSHTFRA